MNETDKVQYRAVLRDLFNGYRKSRIVLTAFELDLFSIIGSGEITSREIAVKAKTDPRATAMLLDVLCGMNLLVKNENKYSNTEGVSLYLDKHSSHYISGFHHTVNLWDTWSTLTHVVREGKTQVRKPINAKDQQWLESFIEAMHDRARQHAPALIANIDLSGVNRILDVGGGPGTYAMAFVNAMDNITADVFDLPHVIPMTKKYIESAGLSEKMGTVTGDYLVDSLGKGYDLVFLSAIIHSNSFEENSKLLKKCAAALNAGGKVVIQDYIMDNDRTTPLSGALFAINMLVGTDKGTTYTEAEVRQWFLDAGLHFMKRIDTPFDTTQIIGIFV
jgi:predicted O-methyltransferase YrrM